jgi:hypothetical protein
VHLTAGCEEISRSLGPGEKNMTVWFRQKAIYLFVKSSRLLQKNLKIFEQHNLF